MVIKKIILIIGILVVLVGLSQVLFASWWLAVYPSFLVTGWLAAFGIFAIILGCIMLIAAVEKLVLLRGLFFVLGAIILGVGIIAVLSPSFMCDLGNALVVKRSQGVQMVEIRGAGVLRMILGALIIYAVVKAPVAETTTVQPPPTE